MAKKRKISLTKGTRKRKLSPLFLLVLILFSVGYLSYLTIPWNKDKYQYELPKTLNLTDTQKETISRVEKNYGRSVEQNANKFELPAAYIKALIVLECSGYKVIKPRFEKHVYNSLIKVRDGKQNNYYNLKQKKLKNLSDAAIKNLASSWGPFQLMGYQVFNLGIRVHDIRGENSIYWGIKWINNRYGTKLKNNHYRDCFHIHNAGYKLPGNNIPKTHAPDYIPNGMKYIKAFETLADKQKN